MTRRFWDWRRFVRLLRVALGLAVAVVTAIILFPLVRELFVQANRDRVAVRFLISVEAVYCVAVAISLIGTMVLAAVVFLARRRGIGQPMAARGLLLASATLIEIAFAEAGAWAWRTSTHDVPSLPAVDNGLRNRLAEPDGDSEVTLVVLGGSSAAGVPSESWLSMGRIVAWQLGEVIPRRRFRALVLAEPGNTLEGQYRKLAGLRRRPDVLIVDCGHNEFSARFPWSRKVDHYRDDRPSFQRAFNDLAGRNSSLYRVDPGGD